MGSVATDSTAQGRIVGGGRGVAPFLCNSPNITASTMSGPGWKTPALVHLPTSQRVAGWKETVSTLPPTLHLSHILITLTSLITLTHRYLVAGWKEPVSATDPTANETGSFVILKRDKTDNSVFNKLCTVKTAIVGLDGAGASL